MSDIERLAQSERVTEWINPFDERLQTITGETPPNGGAAVRKGWQCGKEEETQLLTELKRLLLPQQVLDSFVDFGTATFRLADSSHFTKGFALDSSTNVIDRRYWTFPARAWASVGLCGKLIGLAVFVEEHFEPAKPDDMQAMLLDELAGARCEVKIQKLPADKLEALIEIGK